MNRSKIKPLPLAAQMKKLLDLFPNSKCSISCDTITWVGELTPSAISSTYKIRILMHIGDAPKTFVIVPKSLTLADGKTKLPHVFSSSRQQLCLYYKEEWNSSMLLVNSIVPWASSWLLFYEIWQITGIWDGGGVSHGKKRPFINDD